jgi:hypothetical protein
VKPRRTKQEQKSIDDARLLRAWRNRHAEQLVDALAGVHRDVLGRVMAQLENLKSARELLDAVAAEDWNLVDASTKLTVLHEVNVAISALREKPGMSAIDGPLPGEHDIRIIKTLFASTKGQ